VGVGNQTVYAYNLDRQLTTITRPDAQTLTFTYDAAGRRSTLTIPDGQYTYAYSGSTGHLASITAPDGGTLSYSYDGGLLTGITWAGTVAGGVSRTFDTFFRLSSESIDGANTVTFQYDNDGLLTAAGALTLSRNAQNGLLTGTTLGGVTDTRTYDGFAEVTEYSAAYGGSRIFDRQYTYDPPGRLPHKAPTQHRPPH